MTQENEINKKQKDLVVFNPGSERNLISICLRNNDKLIEATSEDLYPEHFSVEAHRNIYSAMIYLNTKNIKPTPMAIMEVLSGKAKEAVEELGGLDYLLLLEETRLPEDNIKIFIEKIKQAYTRKTLLQISDNVKDFVLSDKAEVLNPSELVGFVEEKISDLLVNTTSSEEVYKMGMKTEEILDKRAENPSQIPGLEVGWETYDKLTNGAQPGDLIVVCAPSKTGKSATLTNWATKLGVRDKLPILYIDTEMNEREQEDRILSNLTGIPYDEIVSGMYVLDTHNGTAEDKIARLKQATKDLQDGQYYHIHMPQFTIEKVTAIARKFHLQFGIVALFFDYIKVPSNQANFKDAQEYQKLGFFTSGLKELASMLQIPVITACQTNRNDTDPDDPDESNIGGSYRILQLATKLMFLYNKTEEQIARDGIQNGNQRLFIKFQRNGQSNCPPINIMFDRPIIRQYEV